jgi:dTDP-glucose pyrophosphorylase
MLLSAYDRDALEFPSERISRFAIAKLDQNNQLLDILEKPSADVLELIIKMSKER